MSPLWSFQVAPSFSCTYHLKMQMVVNIFARSVSARPDICQENQAQSKSLIHFHLQWYADIVGADFSLSFSVVPSLSITKSMAKQSKHFRLHKRYFNWYPTHHREQFCLTVQMTNVQPNQIHYTNSKHLTLCSQDIALTVSTHIHKSFQSFYRSMN